MKDRILFVTKRGEHCDEGFPYALELGKSLHADVEVLILKPFHFMNDIENAMTAATFAEAGDLKGMEEILRHDQDEHRRWLEARLMRNSRELPVVPTWHRSEQDAGTAIQELLKYCPGIKMVLLSPSLSETIPSVKIRKLIRSISKPIVHISKPQAAEI